MRGRDFQENKPEMLQIWMTLHNIEFDKNHLLQRFLLKADRHIHTGEACLVSKHGPELLIALLHFLCST